MEMCMHSGAELRLASQRVSPGFVASRLFHQNGAHSPGIRGRIRASSGSLSDADTPEIVPTPPNLGGKSPRKSWNAASLAFLGDSVWELYVRRKYFFPPSRVSDYYAAVVGQDVLRWGRNATGTSPKRFNQGGPSREVYRAATAVECLVGYLYLTDPGRLHVLMQAMGMAEQSDANAEPRSSQM